MRPINVGINILPYYARYRKDQPEIIEKIRKEITKILEDRQELRCLGSCFWRPSSYRSFLAFPVAFTTLQDNPEDAIVKLSAKPICCCGESNWLYFTYKDVENVPFWDDHGDPIYPEFYYPPGLEDLCFKPCTMQTRKITL